MSRPETTTDALVLPTAAAWRAWLEAHADTSSGVWLAVRRRRGATLGVDFRAAVEEALCLGWIDGQARSDERGSYQRFTPRRPRSTWSAVNRARVGRLTAKGRMAPRGLAVVEEARRTGAWDRLADAQAGVVPDDLAARLAADDAAKRHFASFPPSSQRLILTWVADARRPETRERRIAEAVACAARGERTHHPSSRSPGARVPAAPAKVGRQ